MAYKQIADYGIIGDLSTVALVGKDGAVDWLCLPYLDSPSTFAALLDDQHGGRFSITPQPPWDSVQNYLSQTNVLRTHFRNAEGEVELTDFMPIHSDCFLKPQNPFPKKHQQDMLQHTSSISHTLQI